MAELNTPCDDMWFENTKPNQTFFVDTAMNDS